MQWNISVLCSLYINVRAMPAICVRTPIIHITPHEHLYIYICIYNMSWFDYLSKLSTI